MAEETLLTDERSSHAVPNLNSRHIFDDDLSKLPLLVNILNGTPNKLKEIPFLDTEVPIIPGQQGSSRILIPTNDESVIQQTVKYSKKHTTTSESAEHRSIRVNKSRVPHAHHLLKDNDVHHSHTSAEGSLNPGQSILQHLDFAQMLTPVVEESVSQQNQRIIGNSIRKDTSYSGLSEYKSDVVQKLTTPEISTAHHESIGNHGESVGIERGIHGYPFLQPTGLHPSSMQGVPQQLSIAQILTPYVKESLSQQDQQKIVENYIRKDTASSGLSGYQSNVVQELTIPHASSAHHTSISNHGETVRTDRDSFYIQSYPVLQPTVITSSGLYSSAVQGVPQQLKILSPAVEESLSQQNQHRVVGNSIRKDTLSSGLSGYRSNVVQKLTIPTYPEVHHTLTGIHGESAEIDGHSTYTQDYSALQPSRGITASVVYSGSVKSIPQQLGNAQILPSIVGQQTNRDSWKDATPSELFGHQSSTINRQTISQPPNVQHSSKCNPGGRCVGQQLHQEVVTSMGSLGAIGQTLYTYGQPVIRPVIEVPQQTVQQTTKYTGHNTFSSGFGDMSSTAQKSSFSQESQHQHISSSSHGGSQHLQNQQLHTAGPDIHHPCNHNHHAIGPMAQHPPEVKVTRNVEYHGLIIPSHINLRRQFTPINALWDTYLLLKDQHIPLVAYNLHNGVVHQGFLHNRGNFPESEVSSTELPSTGTGSPHRVFLSNRGSLRESDVSSTSSPHQRSLHNATSFPESDVSSSEFSSSTIKISMEKGESKGDLTEEVPMAQTVSTTEEATGRNMQGLVADEHGENGQNQHITVAPRSDAEEAVRIIFREDK
ncbi:unnamed protein product [Acanthoscelides obtectus]|nr:unnamed protein product [Acanthoscelides obtectus]CAK1660543.1 hypothetical protein AOBTE_LOCUS22137 [Acanthoscelides obtectus]